MNPKSEKKVQSLEDFTNGVNGEGKEVTPKRVGDQDRFALGEEYEKGTGDGTSLEDFVNNLQTEAQKKKNSANQNPDSSSSGAGDQSQSGSNGSNGSIPFADPFAIPGAPKPGQEAPNVTAPVVEPAKDSTGAKRASVTPQTTTPSDQVDIDGKKYNVSDLPVGDLLDPTGKKNAQDELAKRIKDNYITEGDAVSLSQVTGLKADDVRSAINAPNAYKFQKSAGIIASDIDQNVTSVAPELRAKGIDPKIAKKLVMQGGVELDQYLDTRRAQLNKQLEGIDRELLKTIQTRSVDMVGTTVTDISDPTLNKQLNDVRSTVKKQLEELNKAAIYVRNLQLNKKFFAPDGITNLQPDYNQKYAEDNGLELKKIADPTGAKNDENRLNAGYDLSQATKFDNARIGMSGTLEALGAQLEMQTQAARDEQGKYAPALRELFDRIENMRSHMDKDKADKLWSKFNEKVVPFNQLINEYNQKSSQMQNLPATKRLQELQQKYKSLSDQFTALSDNYPEVRREELTQGLLDLQAAANKKNRELNSMWDYLSPKGIKASLQLLIGHDLTPQDAKDLSKKTGLTENEIWDLNYKSKRVIGGAIGEPGLIPDLVNSLYSYGKKFQKTGNRMFGDGTAVETDIQNEAIDKDIANAQRVPANSNLFQPEEMIDLNRKSPTYLRKVVNEQAGDLNLNMGSFIHNLADNGAQFAIFAVAGGVAGKVVGLGASALAAGLGAEEAVSGASVAGKVASTLAAHTQRAGEIAGIYGSSFAMGYDDYYKESTRLTNDETKRHLYAANMANWDALGEIILPETDIVRAMAGKKNMFKSFERILAANGDVWNAGAARQFGVALLKGAAIANKEGLEEVFTAVGQGFTKPLFDGKPVDLEAIAQDAKQSYVSVVLGMLPNAVGGGVGSTYQLKKDALWEAGNEPTKYIAKIQDLKDAGKITEAEANRRAQTINTMADIVKNIPSHDRHGREYTPEQKVEIAAQEYRIRKNQQVIDSNAPAVVKKEAEEDKKEAEAKQDLASATTEDMLDLLGLDEDGNHSEMNSLAVEADKIEQSRKEAHKQAREEYDGATDKTQAAKDLKEKQKEIDRDHNEQLKALGDDDMNVPVIAGTDETDGETDETDGETEEKVNAFDTLPEDVKQKISSPKTNTDGQGKEKGQEDLLSTSADQSGAESSAPSETSAKGDKLVEGHNIESFGEEIKYNPEYNSWYYDVKFKDGTTTTRASATKEEAKRERDHLNKLLEDEKQEGQQSSAPSDNFSKRLSSGAEPIAATADEPIEFLDAEDENFDTAKAGLFQNREGKYYIKRKDGSFLYNPATKSQFFDDSDAAWSEYEKQEGQETPASTKQEQKTEENAPVKKGDIIRLRGRENEYEIKDINDQHVSLLRVGSKAGVVSISRKTFDAALEVKKTEEKPKEEKPAEKPAAAAEEHAARNKPKPKPKPATKPATKETWREIGKNADGHPLYEDDNGVRSYVREGIRITEPVGIIPGRGISVDAPENKRHEFQAAGENANISNLTEQEQDELNEELKPDGITIHDLIPHKEVKTDVKTAVSEIAPKFQLTDAQGQMLYGLTNPNYHIEDDDTYDELKAKGWLEVGDTRTELTTKAREFVDKVNARIQTRKGVNEGSDLFSAEANIPEIQNTKDNVQKPQSVPDAGTTDAASAGVGQETSPVQKNVQQPDNDQAAGTGKNTQSEGQGNTGKGDTGTTESVKPVQTKKQEMDDELKGAWNDFLDSLKDAPLTAGGLNPKAIETGVKLVSMLVKRGMYELSEMIRSLIDMGQKAILQKQDTIEGLKAAYGAYRSTTTREERKKMETDDQVDDFIEKELGNLLRDENEDEDEILMGNANAAIEEAKKAVQDADTNQRMTLSSSASRVQSLIERLAIGEGTKEMLRKAISDEIRDINNMVHEVFTHSMAKDIVRDLIRIEREMANHGYHISIDYDNEAVILDNNGEIRDPKFIPPAFKNMAKAYQHWVGNIDEMVGNPMAFVEKHRKEFEGEEAEFEVMRNKELPAPKALSAEALSTIGEAFKRRFGVDFEVLSPDQARQMLEQGDAKEFFFQILDDIDVFDNKDPKAAKAFILKVFQTVADAKEATRAYRKLSLKYHPDRKGSTEIMQYINEVKEKYDDGKLSNSTGAGRPSSSGTGSYQDFWNDFFKQQRQEGPEEAKKRQQDYERAKEKYKNENGDRFEKMRKEREERTRKYEEINRKRQQANDTWYKESNAAQEKYYKADKESNDKYYEDVAAAQLTRDKKTAEASAIPDYQKRRDATDKIWEQWRKENADLNDRRYAEKERIRNTWQKERDAAAAKRDATYSKYSYQYGEGGVPAGFYDRENNKAYLISGYADETTPIHEIFSHPFIQMVQKENRELYENLFYEAVSDKEIKAYVDAEYRGRDQSQRDHEYIARAIDLQARGMLKNKSLIDHIQEFWATVTSAVKDLFRIVAGAEYFGKPAEVKNLNGRTTVRDLVDFVLKSGQALNLAKPEKVDVQGVTNNLSNFNNNSNGDEVQNIGVTPGQNAGSGSVGTQRNDITQADIGTETVSSGDTGKTKSNNSAGSPGGRPVQRPDGSHGGSSGNTGAAGQRDGMAGANGDFRDNVESDDLNTRNYRLADDYEPPATFNKVQRLKDNIAALKVLRTLQQETRRPTKEEQDILAKWVGWGGLKALQFNPDNDHQWDTEERQRLRPYIKEAIDLFNELDPDGRLNYLDSARRSTQNAHYTSFPIIKGIWNAIKHLGFQRGHILEPSSGIGNFFAVMPKDISSRSPLSAVEKDELTGRLFNYLYPDSNLGIRGYEEMKFAPDSFDLIISNIPFGSIPVTDPEFQNSKDKRYKQAREMVHNYFFIESLDNVRPGGLVAFITSMGTLDATTTRPIRELMAEQAEFLGAVRLPNTAFKANANTEVVTDIIFLRKYNLDETPMKNQPFIRSVDMTLVKRDGTPGGIDQVNEWYHSHPDMVVGRSVWGNKLRAGIGLDVEADDNINLEKEITRRLKKVLPENIFINQQRSKNEKAAQDAAAYVRRSEYNKIGNMVILSDGRVGQVTGDLHVDDALDNRARDLGLNPAMIREHRLSNYEEEKMNNAGLSYDDFDMKVVRLMPSNWGKINREKAPHMIDLRDTQLQLLNAELNDFPEGHLNELRDRLNELYDNFVKSYKQLNHPDNKTLLEKENEQYTLKGLEKFDKLTKKWVKSDIFTQRTVNPFFKPEKAENLEQAMLISLQEFGFISMPRMAELLGKTEQEIMGEANKSEHPVIFRTPWDTFESKDMYLTGDVKTKLQQAKEAALHNPAMERNVKALEEVIPPDRQAMNIFLPMHARWISHRYLLNFISDEIGTEASLEYDQFADKMKLRLADEDTEAARGYRTQRRKAKWVIEHALNNEDPKVTYKEDPNGPSIPDEEDTALARQNVLRLKMAWDDWKLKDADRRRWFQNTYNELYNRTVPRKYDGSHLTLPGLMNWTLNPHQKDGVWRILQEKGAVIDHIVGAGKSLVMIVAAMEGRRLGLMKKPMIAGLKSQIPQMYEDFKRAYPMSKVLFPSESDFQPANRKRLLSQIATNDWDAIIIAHPQLDKLIQNPDIAEEVVEEMAEHIRAMMAEETDQKKMNGLRDKLGKLYQKAQELRRRAVDEDVLRFDQLGVDFLMVDESQEYKNLEYSSKYENIKGMGTKDGSKRAFNMLLAVRYLQKLHGSDKGVVFASGTPIANSLTELYSLFRYLNPSGLKQRNIRTFDQWAASFAEATTKAEHYQGNWRQITRFRRFSNASELVKWYRAMADVRTDNNITPPLVKPKRQVNLAKLEMSAEQEYYMDMLMEFLASRGNAFAHELGLENGYDDQKGMNPAYAALAVTFGKKLSLDTRLINSKLNTGGEKIKKAATNILSEYKATDHFKGTQLVFSDLGTPKSSNMVDNLYDLLAELGTSHHDLVAIFGERYVDMEDDAKTPGWAEVRPRMMEALNIDQQAAESMLQEAHERPAFNVYDALKKELVARGIPENEIAFIHGYNSRTQRIKLYKAVNDGEIRVLLGSTSKMGIGVNVQKRVMAVHHLDMPWRPDLVEQREARGVRQGNEYALDNGGKVNVHYYGTEGLLDAYVYGVVAAKKETINGLKTEDMTIDHIDDEGDIEMSGEQMAAILSGDPLFQRQQDVQAEVTQLDNLRRGYLNRRFRAEDDLRYTQQKLQGTRQKLEELRKVKAIYEQNVQPLERDEKLEADIEAKIQQMKAMRSQILGTKEAERQKDWQPELLRLNQAIQGQEDRLEAMRDAIKFDAEINGQNYDSVTTAGEALKHFIEDAMQTAHLDTSIRAGRIWGMEVSVKIIEGTKQSKFSIKIDGKGGHEHFFQALLNIERGGVKLVQNQAVSGLTDIGMGMALKRPFMNLDEDIQIREKNIPKFEADIPQFERIMEQEFPQQEKLTRLQNELNQINQEIEQRIAEEGGNNARGRTYTRHPNAGPAEDDDGDNDTPPTSPPGLLPGAIRRFKINYGPAAYSNILALPVAVWNTAVETVALAVQAGEALGDALMKGYHYIRKEMKGKEWGSKQYNTTMLRELRSRGIFQYNISPAQQKEADKVIRNVARGKNLASQMMEVKDQYQQARQQLIAQGATAQQVAALDDAYAEFERYIMENLAANYYEQLDSRIDLQLRGQTLWQKVKQQLQNRYQRPEQVQREITKAGITIEEKNDMVNRADRWRAIAEAKANKELARIGLSDTDLFIWKGQKKVKDSLFEEMNKKGIPLASTDTQTGFDDFLYAQHAPERNAHVAQLRRKNFSAKLAALQNDLQEAMDNYNNNPTPTMQGQVTRIRNLVNTYEEYEKAYSDPQSNRDYVRMLETKIPKKFWLMDDGGSGMTNQQAAEITSKVITEGNIDLYSDYEERIRETIINKALDMQHEYGLISKEDHDFMKGDADEEGYYKHYVPLRVDEEYFDNPEGFGENQIPSAKIYKTKGADYITKEHRVSPLTQSIINLQAVIYAGEDNKYKQTVAELARSAPDDKIWELQSAQYAPVKDTHGRVTRFDEIKVPDNSISFYEGGQKKYIVINDKALFNAIDEADVGRAIPVLAQINTFFRGFATLYNPNFTVANLLRDLQAAGIVLGAKEEAAIRRNFRRNVFKTFKIIHGSFKASGDEGDQIPEAEKAYWEKIAQEYADQGGNMSWFRPESTMDIIENIQKAYKMYQNPRMFRNSFLDGRKLAFGLAEYFNRFNGAIEQSTRLNIYESALKAGVPTHKAVELARNATINFNKKGNLGSLVDSLWLFLNANIQGTANVMKTVLVTKRGRWFAGGLIAAGLLQSIINNFFSDCDGDHPEDCYGNVPQYEKNRYIIIKIPGTHGFMKIPASYGFNTFYNFGEQLGQIYHGSTTVAEASLNMLKSVLDNFNPMGGGDTPLLQQISPTSTDPVVQWFTNTDGLGRKIHPDFEHDHRPDAEKTFAADSKMARDMATWMNQETGGNEKVSGKIDVSPGTLDWIVETMFTGVGQFVTQTAKTTGAVSESVEDNGLLNTIKKPSLVDIDPKNIPITGRFWTKPKDHADKGMIYDRLDNSYKQILNTDEQRAWYDELNKAMRLGEIAPDKANGYKRTMERNQFEVRNRGLYNIIERSKKEELSKEEIEDFIGQIKDAQDAGEIPETSAKAYRSEITRNQNLLKTKNGE